MHYPHKNIADHMGQLQSEAQSLWALNEKKWRDRHTTKLKKAIALKDYAIENNFFVSDEIIDTLNNAEYSGGTPDKVAKSAANLDKAIRDLTGITYPTTVETVQVTDSSSEASRLSKEVKLFAGLLAAILIVSLIVAIVLSSTDSVRWASALAAILGLMGATVYIIFNLIGIISEKAFNSRDTYTNCLRIVLGPVLGWVLFFGLASIGAVQPSEGAVQSSEGAVQPSEGAVQPSNMWAVLLLPFLAGFSIRLVVGVITQALRAIELVLGIEDRDTQLLRRQRGRMGGG
jgi:hypothetical protein